MKIEKNSIGIDIGGTNIKFGIVNPEGKILKEFSQPSYAQEGPKIVIDNMIEGIYTLIGTKKLSEFRGIGIGVPGKADKTRSAVSSLPNFKDWEYVELKKIMNKKLKTEVRIDNDANCAALGELYYGVGKKLDSFIMVTIGTGVGAGIIYEKKIIRGDSGGAGELGHIIIDYHGPECNCGKRGCVEAYVGNMHIKRRTIQLLNEYSDSMILDLVDHDLDKIDPRVVSEAAYKGDILANKILSDTGRYLGIALASAINLLDIKNIVIGGGVAAAGEKLFRSIEESIRNHGIKSIVNEVKIHSAKLKNSAGLIGASTLLND